MSEKVWRRVSADLGGSHYGANGLQEAQVCIAVELAGIVMELSPTEAAVEDGQEEIPF